MRVGATVPDFELLDQNSQAVTLSELLETGPAVFYFYIKAMTPG